MRIVDKAGKKRKWKLGCDLNITEYLTVITQVKVKLGRVKVKSLCTALRHMRQWRYSSAHF